MFAHGILYTYFYTAVCTEFWRIKLILCARILYSPVWKSSNKSIAKINPDVSQTNHQNILQMLQKTSNISFSMLSFNLHMCIDFRPHWIKKSYRLKSCTFGVLRRPAARKKMSMAEIFVMLCANLTSNSLNRPIHPIMVEFGCKLRSKLKNSIQRDQYIWLSR